MGLQMRIMGLLMRIPACKPCNFLPPTLVF
jgi:hypothetical protein